MAINRTILELKLILFFRFWAVSCAINRTILELKLRSNDWGTVPTLLLIEPFWN